MSASLEDMSPLISAGLLRGDAQLIQVATGAKWCEGAVWLPETNRVRFSDIHKNRILEYDCGSGDLHVYRLDVGFTNGRTLDLDGSVIQCSHGHRRIERERADGVEPVVSEWEGRRFNSPNDVVVKSDGTVWFTDPAYGIKRPTEGYAGTEEYGDHLVFRFDPASGALTPVIHDVLMPNGLAFSADEARIYVTDSSPSWPEQQAPPHPLAAPRVHAYDITDDLRAKNGREFTRIAPGVPDGIRVDNLDNLWCTSADSVQVFRQDGQLIGKIPVPETVANICFGGPNGTSLFCAATTSLYRIETTVTDAAAHIRQHTSRGI